jgi:hypothetical protein
MRLLFKTAFYMEWGAQDLQKQEEIFAITGKRICYKLYPKTEAEI